MKMLAQTITTKSSTPPLIATGHENLKDDSPLALKWDQDEDGVVIESDALKGYVVIELPDGKKKKINLPSSVSVQKRLAITFVPPKVGQKLKKGDFVYRSENLAEDGQLRLGQNLFTAFMYWRGMEFEDSFAISQSAANKMLNYGEHIIEYNIKPGEEINHLVEPGMIINSQDKHFMISVNKELSYTRSQEGLNNLVKVNHKYTKEVGIKAPNNIPAAMVVDVQYKEFIPDEVIKDRLQRVSRMNYKSSPKSKYLAFTNKYGDPNVRRLELPTTYEKAETKGVAYKVYIKLAIANVCKEGDKFSNRFGSKGVVSMIVPDAEMPRTKDGKVVEIIVNPSSVIARKNLPQTSEVILSKISEELWTRVDFMPKESIENKQAIRDLLEKYHFYWLQKMKWSDFIKYHESLRDAETKYQVRTGAYSKYSPLRVAEIQEELGISDKEILIDGKRNREIKTPIMTGYSYILKLHHLAEFTNKVTTGNSRDRNPLALGLGMTRDEGQVIGEMESLALLTHGVSDYLKEVRGNTNSDWFLANMLTSSQVIVDSKGRALLTEVSNNRKSKNNYN